MSAPTQYRTKPVEVEAMQFDGTKESAHHILDWVRSNGGTAYLHWECGQGDSHILIRTLEGDMTAPTGWWIIHGLIGEFYPCRDDAFDAKYEEVAL